MPHDVRQANAGAAPAARIDFLWLALVVATAAAVRLAYLLELRASPFFDHLILNAADYDAWARNGYPASEPYYQAPLYVQFLRGVYALASEAGRFGAARAAQALCGVATTGLVFLTARRWLGRTAALVAGFLCALARPLVFFDGEILPATLEALLLTASVAAAGSATGRDTRPRTRIVASAIAGLALGAAATLHGNVLVLVPLFAALAFFATRGRVSWRRALVAPLVIAAAAALPVSLVTAHNVRARQGFVLLTANAGPNLLLGHNPKADGLSPFLPDEITRFRRARVLAGATQVELSRAAEQESWAYLRAHPGRCMGLWWKKLVLFYNQHEIPNDRSIRDQYRAAAILRWPPVALVGVGLLLPLALAGLFARRMWRQGHTALAVTLAALPFTYMPFIVCARFRAPLVPLLCIAAGAAVARALQRPARREWIRMGGAALAGVILAWPNWFGVRGTEFPEFARNEARMLTDVAQASMRTGDMERARPYVDRAREVLIQAAAAHPQSAYAQSSLAGFYTTTGDTTNARRVYETAIALDPAYAEAHVGLAWIAIQGRDPAGAERHVRQAIASDPGNPDYAVRLGDVLFGSNQFAAAIEAYQRYLNAPRRDAATGVRLDSAPALSTAYARAQIHLANGRVAELQGDLATAEVQYGNAYTVSQGDPSYVAELALFYSRHDEREEALRALDGSLGDPKLAPDVRGYLQSIRDRIAAP